MSAPGGPEVAVIGGGIAGLSAAWELHRHCQVTVLEESRLGGCVRSERFDGRTIELGPDAFIARAPEAVSLCAEVGIESQLVAPSAGRSLIWTSGRLREMPEATVLGVPKRLRPLARSRVLSPAGVARAALDLALPRRPLRPTASVRELVASRMGAEVADRLVGPLVGSIHAGDIADLGAVETVPQLWAAAGSSRSLMRGLRARPEVAGTGAVFLTPRQGLGHLVEVLVDRLRAGGVRFETASVGGPLARRAGRIELAGGAGFDAVVLAVPAPRAADLLGGDLGAALRAVTTVSVALVVASLKGVELPAGVNGFVSVPVPGRLMTACSFASNKWPHWVEPGGCLVRISAGRRGDERSSQMDDAELTGRLLGELGRALGADVSAGQSRVARWPGAFPQYRPGHLAAMTALQDELGRQLPGAALAGSAFGGIGIPACIASGRRAARRVLAGLGAGIPSA